jgi:hypothetical protein
MFETALNHKLEDQLGTFGEITLDKKSHATDPLRPQCRYKFQPLHSCCHC